MIDVGLNHYMVLSAALFAIGAYGALSRRNAVSVLMSIELLLNSVNVALVAISRYVGTATGQVFAVFVITVAAAEASVALALLIAVYRNRGSVDVEEVNILQG